VSHGPGPREDGGRRSRGFSTLFKIGSWSKITPEISDWNRGKLLFSCLSFTGDRLIDYFFRSMRGAALNIHVHRRMDRGPWVRSDGPVAVASRVFVLTGSRLD
jgi:hypothetical protein